MVHADFFLAFKHLSFELCLLGLASFLGPFCFGTFWRFYSKKGECETKASLWLKLTSGFKDMRPKGENVNLRSKRGKFDLGGVWMMVSIQASVSGSNSVNFCKFMLDLVVLS
jgi:hypothetical protein